MASVNASCGYVDCKWAVCVRRDRSFARLRAGEKLQECSDAISESLHVPKLQKFLAGKLLWGWWRWVGRLSQKKNSRYFFFCALQLFAFSHLFIFPSRPDVFSRVFGASRRENSAWHHQPLVTACQRFCWLQDGHTQAHTRAHPQM